MASCTHCRGTKNASLSQMETNGRASGHIFSHASQQQNEMLDINVLTLAYLQKSDCVIANINGMFAVMTVFLTKSHCLSDKPSSYVFIM